MKGRFSKKSLILRCVLTAMLLILFIWTAWGNTALMVSNITVSGSRIPLAFSGFRIAHVSDLHNAQFGENNEILLQELSQITPDIIVITGDLVDAQHTDIGVALDFAKGAVQIAPVYYVTGNHETSISQSQYDQLITGLETAGVEVLVNEAIPFEYKGEEIAIIGLSDPPAMVNAKLKRLMDGEDSYTILLSHRPELFEEYVNSGVDLVLSGHAHGGQFRLPFIGGLIAPDQGLFPKYDGGLYTDNYTNMVVSRGLGNSIIPVRFNNRPEIVLVELKAE